MLLGYKSRTPFQHSSPSTSLPLPPRSYFLLLVLFTFCCCYPRFKKRERETSLSKTLDPGSHALTTLPSSSTLPAESQNTQVIQMQPKLYLLEGRPRDPRPRKTCGITLSKQQASPLAPIHNVTPSHSSSLDFLPCAPDMSDSSLENQGPFRCYSKPTLFCIYYPVETAILMLMTLTNRPGTLFPQSLSPAYLLSVDSEPLGCYGQKCSHSLSVHRFHAPLPMSICGG